MTTKVSGQYCDVQSAIFFNNCKGLDNPVLDFSWFPLHLEITAHISLATVALATCPNNFIVLAIAELCRALSIDLIRHSESIRWYKT